MLAATRPTPEASWSRGPGVGPEEAATAGAAAGVMEAVGTAAWYMRPMRHALRRIALLAVTLPSLAAAQAAAPAPAAQHAPSAQAAAPAAAAEPPADFGAEARALMRVVTCQGGDALPAGLDAAIHAAYCKRQEKAIAAYREKYLPVAAPFLAKLRPAGLPTTVVYPFGGGDLLSALTTYPDGRDYTTASLEHAGDPRRLAAIKTKGQLADSLETIRATSAGLLYANDSKTENLMKGQRGEIPGQLAFFLTALAVHGYEPVSLRFFRVEKDGTLHYFTPSEIAAVEGEDAKLLRGKWTAPDFSMAFSNSELTFVKQGEDPATSARVHRHLAWDLSDSAVKKTGIIQWLSSKGPICAMTKAASYLLWREDFSRVRNYLLKHMVLMISDSTGIPPRWAAAAGFTQETYGTFEVAFLETSPEINADFVALWTGQPRRRLPMRYGYIDGAKPAGHTHLLVTRKGPAAK